MSAYIWDDDKDDENLVKHGVSFFEAQDAFDDPHRLIVRDDGHSQAEERWFCIGSMTDDRILTVRFTWRGDIIRIIGAGYWRKERKLYEEENTRYQGKI